MFQTLGHLMHHMQDMAQPQHVRNDMHCDLLSCLAADIITAGLAGVYSPSGYEKYTNKLEIRQSLNFAPSDVGYDIRSNAFTDNFLGTSPSGSPLTARSSTFSIFDPDLQPNQTARFGRFFSLNRFNYDDMNKHLIPRAVAFSAGMINYFFRGKIDFVVDPNPANRGGFLIKNLGPEPMKGKFALYYNDRSGDRHPVPDAGGCALVWDTTALLASASGMLNAG